MNELKFIEIETHNACNRKCKFCLFGEVDKIKFHKLEDELITKIIDDLCSMQFIGEIAWYGINEPLLDKRIFGIIRETNKKLPFANVVLTTNGDFLDQKKLDLLFDCGLGKLNVSIYDENAAKKVLSLSFKHYNVRLFNFFNNDKDNYFLNINPYVDFFNRAGDVSFKENTLDAYNYSCWRPYTHMSINCYGKLKLCCNDMYAKAFADNYNIKNMTILELWESDVMVFYRQKLKHGRKNLFCQSCDFILNCNKIDIPYV